MRLAEARAASDLVWVSPVTKATFLPRTPLPDRAFDENRVQHTAVAFTVQVLDGQLIGAQLVRALVGIGAGLRHVEAERDFNRPWPKPSASRRRI
jgi:hypothetical protein